MHRLLTPRSRPLRRRDERGAVAIIVALSMTALLVIAAMVLDFGLIRVDRQVDRSAADSATLAGLHGLNAGDGAPHPYVGVCTAVRYLKANNERFSTINGSTGWSNGLGMATGDGCSDVALRNRQCKPADKTTWARFHWVDTGKGLEVTVESGYDLAASPWAEDTLPASNSDTGVAEQRGCDHLAVTITQTRTPGLGGLATSSDLTTSIRSVGRVKSVPGDAAPAMLLLKQTGCPVLKTGSNGGGSFIHVKGAVSSNGRTQPGTIHSDSNGTGCTGASGSSVYNGLGANGIVAYAAPLASNPSAPDPAKPGWITSVAAANGLAAGIVRDSIDNVYGSSALSTGGTKSEVTGRTLITRKLVDERYFTGVKAAIDGAWGVFTSGSSGWTTFPTGVDPCRPTQAQVDTLALSTSSRVYVNCTDNNGFVGGSPTLTIPAGTVYFRGTVNPGVNLQLPNAHHVYIENQPNKADALSLGSAGAAFRINNQSGNIVAGACSTGQNASKAVLFVKTGAIKESTGGTLQMCRTTVFMMGGKSDGCVPVATGTAPRPYPCGAALPGTGQFTQTGGVIDWTAPDTLDPTINPATGDSLPDAVTAWEDPNGPEDLALWSESASTTNEKYNMGGGGAFWVRGVFMAPNADPFTIGGGGTMNLTNAQYIASSIELNGTGTNITMAVDPNSAVTLPELGLVGLVR